MIATDFCSTGLSQEIQDIPLLLTQRNHSRQDAFCEHAACFALGAKAASAPDDTPTQGSLGGVVGGLNAFLNNEGPQSGFQSQDVVAGLTRARMVDQSANLQQVGDLGLNGLHRHLEVRVAQGSVSRLMPKFKHGLDLFEQQGTDNLRLAASIHEGLEIAFQVRPTQLTSQGVQPNVSFIVFKTTE